MDAITILLLPNRLKKWIPGVVDGFVSATEHSPGSILQNACTLKCTYTSLTCVDNFGFDHVWPKGKDANGWRFVACQARPIPNMSETGTSWSRGSVLRRSRWPILSRWLTTVPQHGFPRITSCLTMVDHCQSSLISHQPPLSKYQPLILGEQLLMLDISQSSISVINHH